MKKLVPVKGVGSFVEMMEDLSNRTAARIKKFEESGGMCTSCGKVNADARGWDPMLCSACNADIDKIRKKLSGVMEIRLPVRR